MKTSIMRSLVVLVSVTLLLAACNPRENVAGTEATETIAPATPQPQPTGTDAMTQTVNIEDSRTDADGGALTNPGGVSAASPTTTATDTAATSTAPTTR